MRVVDECEAFAASLSRASPALARGLARDGWVATPDPEILTSWFSDIGRTLATDLGALGENERYAVFAAIEERLATGSELMRTAIATGLLEALASAVSGGRLGGPVLAAYLGPRSRAYLDAWDGFTLGRSSLDPAPPTPRRSWLRRWLRPGS